MSLENKIGLQEDVIKTIKDKTGFQIIKEIGRGGMGFVYGAEKDGSNYAIKLMKSESFLSLGVDKQTLAIKRFRTEIESLQKVHSKKNQIDKELVKYLENIVKIHTSSFDYDFDPDFPMFYVMDKLPNEIEGLANLVKSNNPKIREKAFRDTIKVCRDLSGALCILHNELEYPVIHRDIKPGNIMGTVEVPILTDFGLAKEDDMEKTGATGTMEAVGSPFYMSPEQARGKPSDKELQKLGVDYKWIDGRCDVFSLGAFMYKSLIGKYPIYNDKLIPLINEIGAKYTEVVWPREFNKEFKTVFGKNFDPKLERILVNMLHKNRDKRPTAFEVKADLSAYLQNSEPAAKIGWGRKIARELFTKNKRIPKLSVRVRSAILGIALLGLGGLGLYTSGQQSDGDVAYKSISTKFEHAKQISKSKKLDDLLDVDNTIENAVNENNKAIVKYGEERFKTAAKELDKFDDKNELEIAYALKDKLKGIDTDDKEFDKTLNLYTQNLMKSKEEILIKNGSIPKEKFTNYYDDVAKDGKWKLDAGSRWNVGYWPAILLMMYDLNPDSMHASWFNEWMKPLVGQNYSEKYNMPELMADAFAKGSDVFNDDSLESIVVEYAKGIAKRFDGKNFTCYKDAPSIIGCSAGLYNKTLFWAFEKTGNLEFYNSAVDLTNFVADKFVNEDGSSLTKIDSDKNYSIHEDNYSKKGLTWSKGQASLIDALNEHIIKTGDLNMLGKAELLADHYIKNIKNGGSSYYLNAESGLYDSFSSAYAADVLISLAKIETHFASLNPKSFAKMNAKSKKYLDSAKKLLKEIACNYTSVDTSYQPIVKGTKKDGEFTGEISTVMTDYYFLKASNNLVNPSLFEVKDRVVDDSKTTISGFMERNTGKVCSKKMYAELSCDDGLLYIKYSCASGTKSKIRKKDGKLWDDLNSTFVVINSKNDDKPAYVFGVNPAETKYDGLGDDNKVNLEWSVKASKVKKGWEASFKIPYKELGIKKGDEIDFNIISKRNGETYSWNFTKFTDIGDYRGKVQALYSNPGKVILR